MSVAKTLQIGFLRFKSCLFYTAIDTMVLFTSVLRSVERHTAISTFLHHHNRLLPFLHYRLLA